MADTNTGGVSVDSRPSIELAVYSGPSPKSMFQTPLGDVEWQCECGATGISSNQMWAESDVNRHRRGHDMSPHSEVTGDVIP